MTTLLTPLAPPIGYVEMIPLFAQTSARFGLKQLTVTVTPTWLVPAGHLAAPCAGHGLWAHEVVPAGHTAALLVTEGAARPVNGPFETMVVTGVAAPVQKS